MNTVFFISSFLVSSSHETFVKENRCFFGGGGERYRRISHVYIYLYQRASRVHSYGEQIFRLGTRASRGEECGNQDQTRGREKQEMRLLLMTFTGIMTQINNCSDDFGSGKAPPFTRQLPHKKEGHLPRSTSGDLLSVGPRSKVQRDHCRPTLRQVGRMLRRRYHDVILFVLMMF